MTPIAPVRATCVPPQADRSKSVDLDQPQRALARPVSLRSGSARGLLGGGEPDADGPVLPHDPVRFVFGGGEIARRQLARDVDRRGRGPEMEAHRPRAEQPIERGRQHVLAGVLLHVVEPARPVDGAVHGLPRREDASARFHHVHHVPVIVVDDVDDAQRRRACRCRTAGRRRSG